MGAGAVMVLSYVVLRSNSKKVAGCALPYMVGRDHTGGMACANVAPPRAPHSLLLASTTRVLPNLQAALDSSGKGGKGGGKGDRAQGISQGVDTIDKAMEIARNATC